jgi:hypothetical protein
MEGRFRRGMPVHGRGLSDDDELEAVKKDVWLKMAMQSKRNSSTVHLYAARLAEIDRVDMAVEEAERNKRRLQMAAIRGSAMDASLTVAKKFVRRRY